MHETMQPDVFYIGGQGCRIRTDERSMRVNRRKRIVLVIGALLLAGLSAVDARAQSWESVDGPFGGTFIDVISHNDSLVAAPYYRSFLLFGNAEGTRWRRVDMPSAAAEAFCLHSPGGGRLLAGSFGRVYRTDDEGAHWSDYTIPDLLGEIVTEITGEGDTLYACGGGQLLRSIDRGARWSVLEQAPETGDVLKHGGQLWVGGPAGLFVSMDGGMQWQRQADRTDTIRSIEWVDGILFAALSPFGNSWNAPLLRSSDDGAQWTTCQLPMTVLSSIVAHKGQLYAGVNDPGAQHVLYRSTDRGEHWEAIQERRTPFPRSVWHLHSARQGLLASLGGIGLWRLEDDAESWRYASYGHFPVGVAKLAFHPDGTIFAYSMKERFVAMRGGEGMPWELILYPGNGRPGDMLLLGDTLFLGGTGELLVSTDRGAQWDSRPIPMPGATIQALHYSEADRRLFAGAADRQLLQSDDGGRTWERAAGAGSDTGGARQWFDIANRDAHYNDIVALSSIDSYAYSRSTGQWDAVTMWPVGLPYDVTEHGLPVYYASERGLLAQAWGVSHIETLLQQPCYAVARSDGSAFATASRDSGIVLLMSIDDVPGRRLVDGLPSTGYAPPTVCRIALAWRDHTLYFGNCGLPGLWRITLPSITGTGEVQAVPQSFGMSAPYPNPAHTQLRVQLTLPAEARVRLQLTDQLGRVLREALDSRLSAGAHDIGIDVQSLSAGTYYCVCSMQRTRVVRPVVILR